VSPFWGITALRKISGFKPRVEKSTNFPNSEPSFKGENPGVKKPGLRG